MNERVKKLKENERIKQLKEQINIHSEKREEKLKDADVIVEQVLSELESLRKEYYMVALTGLDKYLIKTMDLEFILPDETVWLSLSVKFDYDSVKLYKKSPGATICVYDALNQTPWLENSARAKLYVFVQRFSDRWKDVLNEQFMEALVSKLEATVQTLKNTQVYCLPMDEYRLKKLSKTEKKQESGVVHLDKGILQQSNLNQRMAKICCDAKKEPILVDINSLYLLDETRKPVHISPEEIKPGMHLYEQYVRYFGDNEQPMLRGLSCVEAIYYADDKIAISTKEYVISNIDFLDEFEAEKIRRGQMD
jgi:hypothetical protein